jgi:hypothetical protein
MARTVQEIQNTMFTAIASDANLVSLNSTSRVAIYRLFVFVVAYAIWLLETFFDLHKSQIDTALYEQKSGTPRWYRNMALAFQHGFDLLYDSDKFDNTDATIDQIEASQIIKYCSVKESLESNKLTIKVAGESGELLIPLTAPQLESFADYMQEIKYAGVRLNIVNNPADKLKLIMSIYRDVLVIDENGNSIKNGGKPVETAVRAYMKSLPFDGELVLNDLIAYLRTIDGVNNAHIVNATSSHWNSVGLGFSEFQPINVRTVPMSGYFEIVDFETVTYVV